MRLGEVLDKPATVGTLIDEKPPVPPFRFGGGGSRGVGGGGSFAGPPTPEEEAIESVGHPLEPVFWAPGLRASGPLASAITGATSAATAGTLEDIAGRRNPLPEIPGNLAAGAALGPLAGLVGGLARRIRRPAPTPKTVGALLKPPPRQPFTGTSAQQQTPATGSLFTEIQRDPAYLRRLNELGGGRVRTNQETLAEAVRQGGPMSPDEIVSWPAERPVNAAIQTRALLTKDLAQQAWKKAVESGDAKAARAAQEQLAKIEPGIQNIRATGGRATQAQAMFVQDRVTQELEKLADMQAKGVPFEQMTVAVNEMKQRLAKEGALSRVGGRLRESIEAIETYATAAKLTSPVTHAINSVSNALTFMVIRPTQSVLRAGFLAGQGRGAEAAGSLQALYGTSAGFQNGLRRWGHALTDDVIDIGKGEVSRGLPLRGKARLLDPFRHLSAADAFWKGVIEDSELHQLAFASARQQGLSGPALAKRISELVNDPPAQWRGQAQGVAKEFTFQEDPDRFLAAVGALRNLPGMRLIMPFIQTPYNIAKFQFQRTPLGALSPRNIKGIAAGGREQADALARLSMGTGFALGAWMTVQRGEVTGEYPKEKAERELWEAEGRKPYSIRIGDRWLAYNRFQPLGMYLGQAAALDAAVRAGDQKGVGQTFSRLMASGGKQVLDQPFVSGMSSLLDALQDPERSAARFTSQTLTGLIPNIMRDVRYQVDPKQRMAKGVLAPTANMIPGLSATLPERVDALGRVIEYDPNRLARASKVLSRSRETPETETMRQTFETRQAEEAGPEKLAPSDQARFDKEIGEARVRGIRIATSQPGHKSLSRDEQADAVSKAVEFQRRAVRARWRNRQRPPTGNQ